MNDKKQNSPAVVKAMASFSTPQSKAWVYLVLAIVAIELPFLLTFLLVELFNGITTCRHEWWYWPVLAGWIPSAFFVGLQSGLLLRLVQVAFTIGLILLVFTASRRSFLGLWWPWLIIGLIASIWLALASLHGMLA